MITPLDQAGALAIVRSRVDKGWIEQILAEPDGQAMLQALADVFVALDAKDAQDASSLLVASHSAQVNLPASGPEFAITTLSVTLRKAPKGPSPLTLPAGTKVQTPDKHVYLTNTALSFAPGEVGLSKIVQATALVAGHPGAIPAGEITQFVPVANGISGVGTAIRLPTVSGSQKALRFTTNTALPHPFKSSMIGLLLEVTSVTTLAAQGNVGLTAQIVAMTDGAGALPTDPQLPENAYAWAATVDTATDARYSVWVTTGGFGFEWRLVDWSEYLGVTSTRDASLGRGDTIGEIAAARGRPRQLGEDAETIRARLLRAPQPPSPVGLLRKAIVAIVPYGFGRLDVFILEQGEGPPDASVDLYWRNFPASMGFILNLHTITETDPATPDSLARYDESFNILSSFVNPGLALVWSTATFDVIVRWQPPGSMPAATASNIRRILFAACKNAVAPGTMLQIYETTLWGYP